MKRAMAAQNMSGGYGTCEKTARMGAGKGNIDWKKYTKRTASIKGGGKGALGKILEGNKKPEGMAKFLYACEILLKNITKKHY